MSVQHLTSELSSGLVELQSVAERVTELVDQFREVCSGLTIEEYATLSLLLRDARDAASKAKSRCTDVRDKVNEHFVVAVADSGDSQYETEGHKYHMGADAFFSPPSPLSKPEEFAALYAWLSNQELDPNRVLFGKKVLTTLCKALRKEGLTLPPYVKEHTIASVTIRKKNK